MAKKQLFLAALFLSEIRTVSPIISLKRAGLLELMGNAFLGRCFSRIQLLIDGLFVRMYIWISGNR